MREIQKLKNARGITLVALVVTIIVLVILAGVSITAVLNQNGVIKEFKEAKEKTLNEEIHEQEQMNEVVDYINDNGKKLIAKDKSYVGYYADVDGDGTVDGIIYADLVVGESEVWNDKSWNNYEYSAITNGLKNYYVSKIRYEGIFGAREVITSNGSGKDRFYVMTLEDFNEGTYYCWYNAAYESGISDYETITSTSFGSGKTNTETVIEKWNSSAYGAQNYSSANGDIWGVIQDKVNEGWFIPSKEEWCAFGYSLKITSSNYEEYGLSSWYWSSSVYEVNRAYDVSFYGGFMISSYVNYSKVVRLSTTF